MRRPTPTCRPGPYVMLAVSDTGTGMPQSVQDKAFEPFFTTKEVGKGSGLGLSMVYGFVKQSGGHIKIYSEEGHGTTIKLYLPPGEGMAEATAAIAPQAEGGAETIFVVEDDTLVRNFVTAQLQSLGYKTVAAADSRAALQLIEAGQAFDLLFTDVVIPGGMSGRELADEVAEAPAGRQGALHLRLHRQRHRPPRQARRRRDAADKAVSEQPARRDDPEGAEWRGDGGGLARGLPKARCSHAYMRSSALAQDVCSGCPLETPWLARIRAGGVPKPRYATSKAVLISIGPVSSKNQAHLKDKSSHHTQSLSMLSATNVGAGVATVRLRSAIPIAVTRCTARILVCGRN